MFAAALSHHKLLRSTSMQTDTLRHIACALVASLAIVLSGCETPKPPPVAPPSGPSAEEIARSQRNERAQINLNEGLKFYDSGNYDEAQRNILLALDTGLLNLPQQVNARKHMAFINCLSNREASCREEFEKVIALDAKFELTPAEAGHPNWGPVFRNLRAEIEARKNGRATPAPRLYAAGEKLLLEGMSAYDAGDYNRAIKLLQDAPKEGLNEIDRIKAIKHAAFSYCLTNRSTPCRAEFEKLFAIRPDFNLEPAEAGHPSWGPTFRAAKAQQAKQKQNKK
jgi:tetratricopeptide (TPR) repeat protein